LIKAVKPDMTNISRFGARPNTVAAGLEQLDTGTVNRRSAEISRLVRSVQRSINVKYIGSEVPVMLTENSYKSINGKTDSYKQVVLPGCDGVSLGSKVNAHIYSVSANALYGSLDGV
ncbi:MiaB-like tRNA modifying enzyme, partial [mine drainage metagenome]